MLFITSDPHLATGTPGKVMGERFPLWHDSTARFCANWRRVVRAEDTVIVAGDISWALKPVAAAPDLQLLHDLPGTKYLLRGNHDYWWPKSETKLNALLAAYPSLRVLPRSPCLVTEGCALAGTRFWKLPSDEYWDEAKDRATYDKELQRLEECCAALQQAPAGTVPVLVLHHPPHDLREARPTVADELVAAAGIKRVYYGHLHPTPEAGLVSFPYSKNGVVCQLIAVDSHDFTPQAVPQELSAMLLSDIELRRYPAHGTSMQP